MALPKPDRTRVELVTRAHCAVPARAYEMWANASPRMQKPEAKESNEIHIYGLILDQAEAAFARDCFGDDTVMSGPMFREQMDKIDGDVVLRINSDGGDVFEASVMLAAIRQRQEAGHTVTAIVEGIAASAASLLASAADTTIIAELGFIMIHEAAGWMHGSANDMRNAGKLLDDINGSAAQMYAERTGIAENEIRQMMADETYMGAEEAVEKGFAAEVQKAPDPDDDAGAQANAAALKASMERRNARFAAVLDAIQT